MLVQRAGGKNRPQRPIPFRFLPVCGKVRAALAKSFYKFYRLTPTPVFLNFQARN
jgi:hypothetical protein